MWVQSLCQKDPLEEGMATHSSILAWRIPWTEEPAGLQSMGSHGEGTQLAEPRGVGPGEEPALPFPALTWEPAPPGPQA